jgi:hypothetical protein
MLNGWFEEATQKPIEIAKFPTAKTETARRCKLPRRRIPTEKTTYGGGARVGMCIAIDNFGIIQKLMKWRAHRPPRS